MSAFTGLCACDAETARNREFDKRVGKIAENIMESKSLESIAMLVGH